MWMKYRHSFSSGHGEWEEWEWCDLWTSDAARAKSVADEQKIAQEHDWNEHYRGVTYELVDAPPREVLIRQLEEAKIGLRGCAATVKKLEEQLQLL